MFAYEKPEQEKASKSTVQKKETEKPVTVPNLTGIPDQMKTRFENISGFSFNDVRAHYNSDKPIESNSSKSMNKTILQMFKCGYEPKNPNNFREITRITNDGSGEPNGNKIFNSAQRESVLAFNNFYAGIANATISMRYASDHSRNRLGHRTEMSNLEPEVDHIVPKSELGANTYNNARVLSKTENTVAANRPALADRKLIAFENFNMIIQNPSGETQANTYVTNNEIDCDYIWANRIHTAQHGTIVNCTGGTSVSFVKP